MKVWYTKLGLELDPAIDTVMELTQYLVDIGEKPKTHIDRARFLARELTQVERKATDNTLPLNYVRQIKGDYATVNFESLSREEKNSLRWELIKAPAFKDGTPLPNVSYLMSEHPFLKTKIIDLSQARKVSPDVFTNEILYP